MKDKNNAAISRCACAYEAVEFAFELASISRSAYELTVHAPYILSPDLIKLYQQMTDHTIEHLQNLKAYCNIDIDEERRRLMKVRKDLYYINDPTTRDNIRDDTTFIADNIRKKLRECK